MRGRPAGRTLVREAREVEPRARALRLMWLVVLTTGALLAPLCPSTRWVQHAPAPLARLPAVRAAVDGSPPPASQQQPASPTSRRLPPPSKLTTWLSKTENVTRLLDLHDQYADIFNCVHLSVFWHRLGKLVRRSRSERAAMNSLSHLPAKRTTIRLLPECGPRELCVLGWGAASAGVDSRRWPELWQRLARGACALLERERTMGATASATDRFTSQGISNSMWALAKARHKDVELLQSLSLAARSRMGEFNSQELANIAWALATLGHRDERLLRLLADAALLQVPSAQPQGISNMAWAYAKLGVAAPRLFDSFAEYITASGATPRASQTASRSTDRSNAPAGAPASTAAAFKAQELSNVAWAFATAGQRSDEVFAVVADVAIPRLRDFTSQGLTNLVWSHATAAVSNAELFDAIAARVEQSASTFSTQGLANTAWAYATAGHAAPKLFDTVRRYALPAVRTMTSQEMSNLLWAYATAERPAADLVVAIGAQVRTLAPSPTLIGSHPTACLRPGAAARDHCATTACPPRAHRPQVLLRAPEFNEQELANTAWAYATLDVAPDGVFDALAARGALSARHMTPQGLAMIAWAFAHASHPAPRLFDAVARSSRHQMADFDESSLSLLAWSFAAADMPSDTLFDGAARFVERCDELGCNAPFTLHQLHQWQLWRDCRATAGLGTWPSLGDELRIRCAASFSDLEGTPSALQDTASQIALASPLRPRP